VVGNLALPDPVIITYPDEAGNTTSGNRTMLVHWNPGKS
jgi:hypothetical protein